MKLYGSLKELVSAVFRDASSGKQVTLEPNQSTTYTADRTVQTPPQDANSILVSNDATQTLTNKTISGASNTISNVSLTTGVTGILPTANGGTNQNSTATFPTSGVVVTEAAVETLTNKTISGSSNTLTVLAGSQLSGQVPTANGGTGQNSTATFPTSGIVVTEAASETLTNKSIDGSTNTLSNIPVNSATGILAAAHGGTGQNSTATFPTSGIVVTEAASETLTNKTLTAPIQSSYEDFTEIATPSNPSAGLLRVYSKSDNNLYKLTPGGIESQIGSGSGSGSKNYLSAITTSNGTNTGNGDFELGSTTGWSLAHSSLTSNFPSTVGTATNAFSSAGGAHGGSAASGNLSISTVSSSQLAKSFSLSYASSAATTAGDLLISDAFNIDTEDQAKMLTFRFAYQAHTNPANGNFSGTSSNSFGVAIYDVTNALWMMPAGVWNLVQSSGVGISTGTFQTTSNSTQYQIALFNANASSGAITLYLDDFTIGPQTSPMGPAVTDWQAYTPTYTGMGTPANTSVYYRRVGDSLEVNGNVQVGTVSAATMSISLPSGLVLDTSKLGGNETNLFGTVYRGSGTSNNIASAAFGAWAIVDNIANSTTKVYIASQTNSIFNLQNGSTALSNSDYLSFSFMVPISGWSSNTAMSADTDNRIQALRYKNNGGQSITANVTDITFSTSEYDTHAAWNGSLFTAPVTGYYTMVGLWRTTTSIAPSTVAYINGSSYSRLDSLNVSGAQHTFATQVHLNAGDTLSVRSDTSCTLDNQAALHWIAISKVSGPVIVAATESVNARYYASSTSISGSLATVSWTTKDFDTHNAMSAGTYTIPVSGKYQINTGLAVAGTIALNSNVDLQIQKNGTVVSEDLQDAGGAMTNLSSNCSDIISCNAGDTIRVQISSSATGPSIVSSNSRNFFSIARVGN